MSCTQKTKYVVAEHGKTYAVHIRSKSLFMVGLIVFVDGTCESLRV
jgi:hypothetical protein